MENRRTDYSPIVDRKPLKMPNGARVAVWVIPNLEYFLFDRPAVSITASTASLVPDVLNYSWRDYGVRVGIWRMMEVMEKHGVKGTVALNSEVCRHYPRIIEAGKQLGWEWMGHGKTNSILFNKQSEDEERALIAEILDTITKSTGVRPRGWLGPALTESFNTPDLLAEAGIEYVGDWVNDDEPYAMNVRKGALYSIPYNIELNDISAFVGRGWTGEQFYQMLVDQFDVLYEEGAKSAKVMAICLHPFLIGLPFRSKYFDKALGYIAGHDKVWFARGAEIIDWYKRSRAD
jgi:allantoinase